MIVAADRGLSTYGPWLHRVKDWREMAKLLYTAIASLDGYVEDDQGKFDFAVLDEEVHAFLNDLERPGRHPSVRAAYVRDDGLLGDRRRSGGGDP